MTNASRCSSSCWPLRIGPRHVAQQLSACSGSPTQAHRQMRGMRLLAIVRDQGGKAVGPNKVRQDFGIVDSKRRRNIHFAAWLDSQLGSHRRQDGGRDRQRFPPLGSGGYENWRTTCRRPTNTLHEGSSKILVGKRIIAVAIRSTEHASFPVFVGPEDRMRRAVFFADRSRQDFRFGPGGFDDIQFIFGCNPVGFDTLSNRMIRRDDFDGGTSTDGHVCGWLHPEIRANH